MPRFIKFVSALCTQSNFRSSESHLCVNGSYHLLQFLRFRSTEIVINIGNDGYLSEKKYSSVRSEAQAALLEYLHMTRNLHFLDAESMSKNSPKFLDKLLKRAAIVDDDVSHSLARFLRYHPINEFEPFFESIGLEPSEYKSFLPTNLMFLSDDELLLHNYHVLCNHGIASKWIGKIYKEATEIFRYDHGILYSKFQSFQNLGLRKPTLAKIIASSPYLLRGEGNLEFLGFLEKLKHIGIEYDWLGDYILEGDSYNWKKMIELMCRLCEIGLTGEELGEVIRNHPDLLLERSGHLTYRILVFLLKFGSMLSDLPSMFLQFPPITVENLMNNLSQCYKFLVEINMPVQDIGRLFRLHPLLLGSCRLKTVSSLSFLFSCDDDGLRQMVKDDPFVLKKWVISGRVEMGPHDDLIPSSPGFVDESEKMKKARERKENRESRCLETTKFLSSLGFVEESEEMEKALKVFRWKRNALQESFDCLVKAGLRREDVLRMLKRAPLIVKLSKDVIESKISCFVKELGYPLSDLVTCPKILGYKTERIKLRLFMYEWLKNEGALKRRKAKGRILACPEKDFLKNYVNTHPRGLEHWERLKEKLEPKCVKTKFLLSIGFVAESEEIEYVLRVFRGKSTALKENYNCLVKAGLSREDVIEMLKRAPYVFSLSKGVLAQRIDCVKVLGYSISEVVTCPKIITYTPEKIKLRVLMYRLLIDEGALPQKLAISSLFYSDELFRIRCVKSHPKGAQFLERLKEKIYSKKER